MITIRLYLAALTVTFLLSAISNGLGAWHAIVLVCAVLYCILDIREELQDLKKLEAQVSSLSR